MNLKKWKRPAAITALVLGLLALGWIFWPDGKVARARALQAELSSPAARDLPPEQRQQKWQELRRTMDQLTPAQRQPIEAEMGKRFQQDIARYFTLSPQDKVRYLDDQIRRMQQPRPGTPARAGTGGTAQARVGGATGTASRGGAPGNVPGPGAGRPTGPGGPGGPGGGTTAQRDERRQRFLDSSSPMARAQVSQYMRDLNARRAQLGLPPGGRGFGPPR